MQRLSPAEDPARSADSPAARAPFQRELCATSLVARSPRLSRSERVELPARALAPLLEAQAPERRALSAPRTPVHAERTPAFAEHEAQAAASA